MPRRDWIAGLEHGWRAAPFHREGTCLSLIRIPIKIHREWHPWVGVLPPHCSLPLKCHPHGPSWPIMAGRKTLSSRNFLAACLVARPGLGVQKWSHRRLIKGDTKHHKTLAAQLARIRALAVSGDFVFWSYLRFCRQTFELPWFWRYSSSRVNWIILNTTWWAGAKKGSARINETNIHQFQHWCCSRVSNSYNFQSSLRPAKNLSPPSEFWHLPQASQGCLPHRLWAQTSPVFERFYHHCRGTGFSFWVPSEIIETWFGLLLCRVLKLHNMCIWLWWTTFLVNHFWYNIRLITPSSWQNLWQEPLFRFGLIADVQLGPHSGPGLRVWDSATIPDYHTYHTHIKLG